jgi:N-acyl-phosphatidylethanolamine-hydrolysing phospholipase D
MQTLKPLCGLAAGWLLAASSAQANPYYDPGKPHHTPDGFRNNYVGAVAKPFSDLVRWKIDQLREHLPRPPRQATPAAQPELARLTSNRAEHR